jgi:hypothetical protein
MRVSLWIAVNEQGHGAVGLTEEDVLSALSPSHGKVSHSWDTLCPRVALSQLSVWTLCAAMVRASVMPIRFTHRRATDTALRERRS